MANTGSLIEAADGGDVEAVRALIEKGVDVRVRTGNGSTALHCAAARGHRGICAMLLGAGINVNETDFDGRTVLHFAAFGGSSEVIDLLVARGAFVSPPDDGERRTPLHVAAAQGHVDAINLLVAAGADVDERDGMSRTALWQAAHAGHGEAMDLLLALGADVNAADDFGVTPLLVALTEGKTDAARLLLSMGASFAVREKQEGLSPLHIAAARGDRAMVELLLNCGANPDARSASGAIPATAAVAAGHPEIVEVLRRFAEAEEQSLVQGAQGGARGAIAAEQEADYALPVMREAETPDGETPMTESTERDSDWLSLPVYGEGIGDETDGEAESAVAEGVIPALPEGLSSASDATEGPESEGVLRFALDADEEPGFQERQQPEAADAVPSEDDAAPFGFDEPPPEPPSLEASGPPDGLDEAEGETSGRSRTMAGPEAEGDLRSMQDVEVSRRPPGGRWRLRRVMAVAAGLVLVVAALLVPHRLQPPREPAELTPESPGVPLPLGVVSDYANILSPAEEARLEDVMWRLRDDSGAQLVVVTVPYTRPLSPLAYARQVEQAWGLGTEGRSNGVVFLVDLSAGETVLFPGADLKSVLTRERVREILDARVRPLVARGEYGSGVESGTEAVAGLLMGADQPIALGQARNATPAVVQRARAAVPPRPVPRGAARRAQKVPALVTATIVSQPPGATAVIDKGKRRGRTPLVVVLTPGEHEVYVTMPGYRPEVERIRIGVEATKYLIELQPVLD